MYKNEKKYMIIFIVLVAAALLLAAALDNGIIELPEFITDEGCLMFS